MTSPSQPLAGPDRLTIVSWDPGDVIAVGVRPFYRLAPSFALLGPAHLRGWLETPGSRALRLARAGGVAAVLLLLASPWLPHVRGIWDWGRLQPTRVVDEAEPKLRGSTTFHPAALPFAASSFAVGYTLGGGMGWLARRYGLSADSVTWNLYRSGASGAITAGGDGRSVSKVMMGVTTEIMGESTTNAPANADMLRVAGRAARDRATRQPRIPVHLQERAGRRAQVRRQEHLARRGQDLNNNDFEELPYGRHNRVRTTEPLAKQFRA